MVYQEQLVLSIYRDARNLVEQVLVCFGDGVIQSNDGVGTDDGSEQRWLSGKKQSQRKDGSLGGGRR